MKYIATVIVRHQVYVRADDEAEARQIAEREYRSLETLWSPEIKGVDIEKALS